MLCKLGFVNLNVMYAQPSGKQHSESFKIIKAISVDFSWALIKQLWCGVGFSTAILPWCISRCALYLVGVHFKQLALRIPPPFFFFASYNLRIY